MTRRERLQLAPGALYLRGGSDSHQKSRRSPTPPGRSIRPRACLQRDRGRPADWGLGHRYVQTQQRTAAAHSTAHGSPCPGSAACLSLGEARTDVSLNQENNVGSQMGCVTEACPLPPSLRDKVFLSGEQLSVRGWRVSTVAPAGHLLVLLSPTSLEEDLGSTKASARCCMREWGCRCGCRAVSYTHLRAHET